METALRKLAALPDDRRAMLVVRSMPFGDLIEDDTGKVQITRDQIPVGIDPYELCRIAKKKVRPSSAI